MKNAGHMNVNQHERIHALDSGHKTRFHMDARIRDDADMNNNSGRTESEYTGKRSPSDLHSPEFNLQNLLAHVVTGRCSSNTNLVIKCMHIPTHRL